jgi:iron complex transport system ATP-binding protein
MGRTPHLRFLSPPSGEDYRIAREAIETLRISHLSEKAFSEISGGEHQLVLFARALAQQTRLIILDEPTAHLDYGNQVKILNQIQILAKGGQRLGYCPKDAIYGWAIGYLSVIKIEVVGHAIYFV